MKQQIRLGLVGTGRIAQRFTADAPLVKQIKICSVYNPHCSSAERFAKRHGIPFWTDSWNLFISDIDAVYIASPHETHAAYAKMLLEKGIHVLCEKPMAFCRQDVDKLFALAKSRNCILMEAIKTAYSPGYQALVKMAQSGRIGRICDVEACFTKLENPDHRELTDLDYGGSLTELGSYVFLPIVMLLGNRYKKISFFSIKAPNGLDIYTKCMLEYEDAMALGKVGLGVKSEGQLVIAGTKGYILAESPWWLTKKFEVRYENPAHREVYTYPFEESGLQYELAAFAQAVSGNQDDLPEHGVLKAPDIRLAGEYSAAIAEIIAEYRRSNA